MLEIPPLLLEENSQLSIPCQNVLKKVGTVKKQNCWWQFAKTNGFLVLPAGIEPAIHP